MAERRCARTRARNTLAVFVVGALLAGCGGGGSGTSPSGVPALPVVASSSIPVGAPAAYATSVPASDVANQPAAIASPNAGPLPTPVVPGQPVSAVATLHIPTPAAVTNALGKRRAQYISLSSASLKIIVTPQGGAASAPVTGTCMTGTCTVSFTAATGANLLAFTVYDGASGTGNLLGSYSTTVIAQPNGLNTFNLTPNGVVDHVNLTLASSTINAGTPGNVALTVDAQDKDNNTIIGSGNYVDANGTPLAFFLSTTDSQAGGRGTISINGPRVVTAPGQRAIYVHYDGNWLDHTDIAVRASRNLAGASNGTTLTTIPTAVEYNTGMSAGANPHGICTGADGNIWFTEFSGNRIGRITPSGIITEFATNVAATPVKIATVRDGSMIVGYGGGATKISRVGVDGSVADYASGSAFDGVYGIAAAADGNIWTASLAGFNGITIAKIKNDGSYTTFTAGISANAGLEGLTTGPDGALWFTEQSDGSAGSGYKVGRIDLAGSVTEYSSGISAGSGPFGIVTGQDGNIWFTEYTGNRVARITPAGAVSEYSSGLTAGANPRNIIQGPDGNMWVGEDGAARLARVTASGAIQEYSNGIGGNRVIDLTLGPDGNIWYTNLSGSKIGKFVY